MSVQIDGSTGNIIATKADYSGNVSIGGTLTYEDVTNIDSVGLITARNGIKVDDLGVQVGTGATVDSAAANTLTFLTGGSERLRITSSGKVGIGTNNPQEKLHVNGTSDFIVDTDAAGLRFGSYGEHDIALVTGRNTSSGSSRLYIENGNGESLRIDSSGNLGVNETTPDSKLDIVYHTSENSATANLIHLRADPSGSYASRGLFVKVGRDGAYDNSAVHYDVVGSSGNAGTHIFEVQGSEKLRIDSGGKVKIANHGTNDLRTLSVLGPQTQIQFGTAEDVGGFLLSTNNGQFGLTGGGYYNGSNWVAKHTASAQIRTDGDGATVFFANTSLTSGNTFTPTERFRIASGGDVTINNGTLILGTAGQGISFINAADVASGETVSSSVLDDYEEGTFTPVLVNDGTTTYNVQSGSYVKIGRLVHVSVFISIASHDNGATATTGVENMPFQNNSGMTVTAHLVGNDHWDANLDSTNITAWMNNNSSTMAFYKNSGDNLQSISVNDIGNAEISVSATYHTSS